MALNRNRKTLCLHPLIVYWMMMHTQGIQIACEKKGPITSQINHVLMTVLIFLQRIPTEKGFLPLFSNHLMVIMRINRFPLEKYA